MIITDDWLKHRQACADQRKIFRRVFPDGCEITVENAEKAHKAKLDVTWALVRCLDRKGRRQFISFCSLGKKVYYTSCFDVQGEANWAVSQGGYRVGGMNAIRRAQWEWVVDYIIEMESKVGI